MSFEKPTPPDHETALDDWQQMLSGISQPAAVSPGHVQTAPLAALQTAPVEQDPAEDLAESALACGLCYRPFAAEDLSVASKERFNWESSVVVCPECLTELKLEMRARSSGADLLLGLVWAVIGFVVTSGLISLAIYSIRSDSNYNFWEWIGCYFAVVPGFIIGRMVRYGVGRRHSLEQQLIAMFFTLAACFVTAYAGWLAWNNNFFDVLTKSTNRSVGFPPFTAFLNGHLWVAISSLTDFPNILVHLGIDLGIIAGLVTAFFSSEGARIYTRPFTVEAD